MSTTYEKPKTRSARRAEGGGEPPSSQQGSDNEDTEIGPSQVNREDPNPKTPSPIQGTITLPLSIETPTPKNASGVTLSSTIAPTIPLTSAATYSFATAESKIEIEPVATQTSNEDVEFDLMNYNRLQEISYPVEPDRKLEKQMLAVEKMFPAATNPTKLNLPPKARGLFFDRLVDALTYGRDYLGRNFDTTSTYQHWIVKAENTEPYASIFDKLDLLVSKVIATSELQPGFCVRREIYENLSRSLALARKAAETDLVVQGEGIPDLPKWGKNGDIRLLWCGNDFEILAACYRREVENFIVKIISATTRQSNNPFDDSFAPSEGVNNKASTKISFKESKSTSKRDSDHDRRRQEALLNARHAQMNRPEETSSSRVFQQIISTDASISTAKKAKSERKESGAKRDPSPDDSGDEDSEFDEERKRTDKRKYWGKGSERLREGGDDPSDPDDSDDDDGPGGRIPNDRRFPRRSTSSAANIASDGDKIDTRSKREHLPSWDGNPEKLLVWLTKVNSIAKRSPEINSQLGRYIPERFTGSAETWYYNIREDRRLKAERNWETLKKLITAHHLHEAFMEKQRIKANNARFRDTSSPRESPSEYFDRKVGLLELCFDYNDREMIREVMRGAPQSWSVTLQPSLWKYLDHLQMQIRSHEDTLLDQYFTERRRQDVPSQNYHSRNPFTNHKSQVRVNAVGWSKAATNPAFPKDDATVSKKSTPEQKGARPCRHCGSGKHWDRDCKYARKGERLARTNMVQTTSDDERAQEEYDDLYYAELSEGENEMSQDFR